MPLSNATTDAVAPGGDETLQRAFIAVAGRFGHRQVHYRTGGRGPIVLLLHQSPQSSREMEALIRAWGHDFRLIAPDAPGYGFSTPLCRDGQAMSTATIDDFAAATVEFLDAIGVRRCGIYGFHTGASVAVALTEAFPDRVTAVAANGLVILNDEELALIQRDYLPPLEPRWDGSHLAWLWARLREQTIFFPWHDRRAASRMDFDVPPPDRLQLGVEEFLAAGEHYRVAYAAAFESHAERRLPRITTPLLVTASARDPLAGHLRRIHGGTPPAPVSAVSVAAATDAEDALQRAHAHLSRFLLDATLPPAVSTSTAINADAFDAATFDGPISRYHGAPGRQVHVIEWAAPPASRHAVILLHPPAGSAAGLASVARQINPHAAVYVPDLPGHGASDALTPDELHGNALAASVQVLATALDPLIATLAGRGLTTTMVSAGAAAPLGVALSRTLSQAGQLILLDAPKWTPDDVQAWLGHGLPALSPVWAGGHLLEAWHMVRDGRLFTPWFKRQRTAIRQGEPELDNADIHREVRDLLRANGNWQALFQQALLSWPAPDWPAPDWPGPDGLKEGPGDPVGTRPRRQPGTQRAVAMRMVHDPVHWARELGAVSATTNPPS